MKRAPALLLALVLAAAATLAAQQPPRQTFRFEIDVAPELFPPDIVPRSLDGRVLLIVSSDRSRSSREACSTWSSAPRLVCPAR